MHTVQLHTLEDFTAHSNFCELALVNMGYSDVFTHVGDHVRLRATNGKYVAPLVTGVFFFRFSKHQVVVDNFDRFFRIQ